MLEWLLGKIQELHVLPHLQDRFPRFVFYDSELQTKYVPEKLCVSCEERSAYSFLHIYTMLSNKAPRNIHLTFPLHSPNHHPGAKWTYEFLAPRSQNFCFPQKRCKGLGPVTLKVKHSALSWSWNLPTYKVLLFWVPISQHTNTFIIQTIFTVAIADSLLFTQWSKDYPQVNFKD